MKSISVCILSLLFLIIGCYGGKEDERYPNIRKKRLHGLLGGLLDQMVIERLERKKILEEYQAFKTRVGDIERELKVKNNLLQDTKSFQKKILEDVKHMKEKLQEVANLAVKEALKGLYRRISKVEKQGIIFSNEITNTNNALKEVNTTVDGTKTRLSGVEQRCDSIQKEVVDLKNKSDDHWKPIAFTAHLNDIPTTSSTLVFKRVITNIGGGYNVSDGLFHCPKDGLYTFTVTLEGHSRINAHGYLMKNKKEVAYLHEQQVTNGYPSVTATIAIKLVVGDKIWIKGAGIRYYYHSYFTGVYVGP